MPSSFLDARLGQSRGFRSGQLVAVLLCSRTGSPGFIPVQLGASGVGVARTILEIEVVVLLPHLSPVARLDKEILPGLGHGGILKRGLERFTADNNFKEPQVNSHRGIEVQCQEGQWRA